MSMDFYFFIKRHKSLISVPDENKYDYVTKGLQEYKFITE
jgi:hypothetical protein